MQDIEMSQAAGLQPAMNLQEHPCYMQSSIKAKGTAVQRTVDRRLTKSILSQLMISVEPAAVAVKVFVYC